ncbi:MAG: single-stranded DNA-binding protein [Bacilli bacterium]|nr:single-stranded DNA-binding protein [Bacilli bacterium]
MNKVVLVGRLTAKPELRYTPANIAFLRFTIAVNRPFSNKDGNREADFINVVCWRNQAETIAKYFDKGNLISLEGRIQTGSYDDKDGNKRYTTDVALENFEFVESKNARAQSSANYDYIPEPTPYDYQNQNNSNNNNSNNNVDVANDPFAEFGDSVTIDDNFLD